jgi:hypothetical protein
MTDEQSTEVMTSVDGQMPINTPQDEEPPSKTFSKYQRNQEYYEKHKARMKQKMSDLYKSQPEICKKKRNSLNIKKHYQVSEDASKKYKHHLHDVVTVTHILRSMPPEIRQQFLDEFPSLEFPSIL